MLCLFYFYPFQACLILQLANFFLSHIHLQAIIMISLYHFSYVFSLDSCIYVCFLSLTLNPPIHLLRSILTFYDAYVQLQFMTYLTLFLLLWHSVRFKLAHSAMIFNPYYCYSLEATYLPHFNSLSLFIFISIFIFVSISIS